MKRNLLLLAAFALLLPACLFSQQKCLDAADEPHHQLLYQNSYVRIFMVELPRLATTELYCNMHPFFRVAATSGNVSNLRPREAATTRRFRIGEAVYVASPEVHRLRNETGDTLRELEVETIHSQQSQSNDCNYNLCESEFPPDPGSAKQNWTVPLERGGVLLSKTQLAPNASITLNDSGRLLLAIAPDSLQIQVQGEQPKSVDLDTSETILLPAGAPRKITNTGNQPAEFVTVEF